MSELLKDVDEMMRQERLMQIWKTWGNYIIAAILGVILAVALNQGYQAWYKSAAEKSTAAIQTALNDKDPVTALQTLADGSRGNAAVLARLMAVPKALDAGKPDVARKLLLDARNTSSATQDLRDLATIQWVRLMATDKDTSPDALIAALNPLMRDEGQPYAWAARIEAAAIMADRKKDYDGAIKTLAPMIDHPALPQTQSERAAALTQIYQLRQVAKPKPAPVNPAAGVSAPADNKSAPTKSVMEKK